MSNKSLTPRISKQSWRSIRTLYFKKMSLKSLVDFYNTYDPDNIKPVKKFKDKATGVKRCLSIVENDWSIKLKEKIVDAGVNAINKEDYPESSFTSRATNMSSSLKLNRSIEVVDLNYDDDEIVTLWPNAYRMWQHNENWLTGAQVDRLTRTLYAAAKEGRREEVIVYNFFLEIQKHDIYI